MKFVQIFRFEFAYQVRRPWPWLIFSVILVLSFLMTRDDALSQALYEDLLANSPFAIAKTTVIGGLIWLLMGAAIAGEAAARDVATGMYPLLYTTSISKADHLGGRFLAAFVLNALLLLAVQAGILLGVYSPGVDAAVIGPFRPAAYLTAYAFIALPNAFAATALQFGLAVRSGRAMAGYMGSMLLVFMGFFVASLLLFKKGVGTLLDPIGIRFVVEDMAHDWTTIEKNRRLVGLEGTLLLNRLLWVGIGFLLLIITYFGFRFAHRSAGRAWWRKAGKTGLSASVQANADPKYCLSIPVTQAPQTSGFAFHTRQTLAIAARSFQTMAGSRAGLGLLIMIPLVTVLVVIDQMEAMGTPLVPTTLRVLRELTAPLSAEMSRWVIIPLIIVFFAGELVWQEREARMSEILDAMPGSEWAALLGKFLGLGTLVALFMCLLMAAGMVSQAILGYHHFEPGLYLKVLFGLQLPEYLLFAILALAVHTVVNQKYIGHLAAVLVYAFIAVLASMLGIEHNLLVYSASPAWSYTDMRGFGPSIGPWLWFKLYWASCALLLAVVARLFWVRGRESGAGIRIHLARLRLNRYTIWVSGIAAGLIVLLGGFIFYNTNILNRFLSTTAIKERQARYERLYGQYAGTPQPVLTGASVQVGIYPRQQAVAIRGTYRLVNNSTVPVGSIHLATAPGSVETRAVTFDRAVSIAMLDEELGYRIYSLKQPLRPGDSLRLHFEVNVERHGFGNRGVNPSVQANGSAFSLQAWLPAIGYQRQRELVTATDRREHKLPARPVIASLYEAEEGAPAPRGGGVAFEAVVSTDQDQVAVAPGALRRTWTRGARRYYQYSTDAPIGTEWSVFSARYAVHAEWWKGIRVSIFHNPAHTAYLRHTMQSVRASLEYYTQQFGPYPYHHLSIIEHPGAPGTSLHADASMISHGEGYPLWLQAGNEGGLDLPYAVMAHEMAHQWTVPYALVEGAPFLSEGLAWYSAMGAVRASRGDDELRRLLHFMRQPYPYRPIRRGEPLLRALDPYMSYRKGPFALYAMSEYIGADRVNGAIRRMLEQHGPAGAPLATTLDLYRELKAATPDSLRYLLHDLFEVNTYWELKTAQATATRTGHGNWQVQMTVQARKVVYDSAGVETAVPMNDWVEIGIFAPAANGHDELSAPLYLTRHRIHSGTQTVTVTVPQQPARAGIDPRLLLTDLEIADNTRDVKTGPSTKL